jgi:hypothetical protein
MSASLAPVIIGIVMTHMETKAMGRLIEIGVCE